MPISQGNFSFSTGRDLSIKIIDGSGGNVDLDNLQKFEGKEEYKSIEKDLCDGTPLFADLPKGWSGSFELIRSGSQIDNIFANAALDWFDNGAYTYVTIYAYIGDPTGKQQVWTFTNCAIKLEDAGSFSGDDMVIQKISFRAQNRLVS